MSNSEVTKLLQKAQGKSIWNESDRNTHKSIRAATALTINKTICSDILENADTTVS